MAFKFEKLEVWQQSLDYIDLVYELIDRHPSSEDFNLKSHCAEHTKPLNAWLSEFRR